MIVNNATQIIKMSIDILKIFSYSFFVFLRSMMKKIIDNISDIKISLRRSGFK